MMVQLAKRVRRAFGGCLLVLTLGLAFGAGPVWAANPYIFSTSFSETTPGNHLGFPLGLAVDPAGGHVYVADDEAGVIDEFGVEGQLQAQIPGAGTAVWGLAVDNSEGPSRGEVYAAIGEEAGMVDRSEMVAGKEQMVPFIHGLAEPKGIAVDSQGNIYVALGTEVSKYNSKGEPLATPLIGGITEPYGVAVGPTGDVYVVGTLFGTVAYNAAGECLVAGCAALDPNGYSGVTVDPVTGDVYSLESPREIGEYMPTGTLIEEFGAAQLEGHFAAGIGVDDEASPFGQQVYVSDASLPGVEVYLRPSLEAATGEPVLHGTSVTFRGAVTPGGEPVGSCEFEYGEASAYGSRVACAQSPGSLGAGKAPVAVSAEVGGLTPTKTYHYRLVAANAKASIPSPDATVKVLPLAPAVQGVTTSAVEQSYAVLGAQIDPNGGPTTYHFQYGPTASYGTSAPVPDASAGKGGEYANVAEPIEGLQPDSTYHYRVVASNEGGTTATPDQTFTTAAIAPPLVSIVPAGEVTQNTARISGTVDPQGVETSYEFDLGTDTTYGSRISGALGSSTGRQSVTLALQDLAPETTYHYRLVAHNFYGSAYSPDETFTTPGFPSSLLAAPATPALVPIPAIALPTEPAAATGVKAPAVKHKRRDKHTVGRHRPKGRKATNAGRAHTDRRVGR